MLSCVHEAPGVHSKAERHPQLSAGRRNGYLVRLRRSLKKALCLSAAPWPILEITILLSDIALAISDYGLLSRIWSPLHRQARDSLPRDSSQEATDLCSDLASFETEKGAQRTGEQLQHQSAHCGPATAFLWCSCRRVDLRHSPGPLEASRSSSEGVSTQSRYRQELPCDSRFDVECSSDATVRSRVWQRRANSILQFPLPRQRTDRFGENSDPPAESRRGFQACFCRHRPR